MNINMKKKYFYFINIFINKCVACNKTYIFLISASGSPNITKRPSRISGRRTIMLISGTESKVDTYILKWDKSHDNNFEFVEMEFS